MKATKATLFYASKSVTLTWVELSADRAVFDAPREVMSSYVRLTFKVGGNWFDVDGVALPADGDPSSGVGELRFAALPAVTTRRLDEAIRATPSKLATPTNLRPRAPRPEAARRRAPAPTTRAA
jgi:hypothetical protein